jgi:phosphoribosylformimino-5-aminoimidazole carboxamide ribotide isomerase
MILYPAIDLMGGRCVRLRQGRFEAATVYASDLARALEAFEAAGATWAHVVDLDGARAGEPKQHGLLQQLAGKTGLKLQVAGGIRRKHDLTRLFDVGVDRAVIGSLAVKAPEQVHELLDLFGPEKIGLALDINVEDNRPLVAIHGWQQRSSFTLWDLAALYPEARHLLVTDIGRDGMMDGPNLALIEAAIERLPQVHVQASGGVSSIEDLKALKESGAAGTVVGKALWEGRLQLSEALDACA